MQELLALGRTGFDLLLVILGFGFIIFIHELGHFLAAKWAGIRVLAFAIGFGPAAVSYRKGLGWRRGSSEPEYVELQRRETTGLNKADLSRVSPTEYRLNWLPLGGYVKMLGQDDLNPGATSAARDSYQNTPVWKRMIVISAGVVMNVLLAAALFIGVFMYGLKTEPPKIGAVDPGSAAAAAVAKNADIAGVREAGLRAGDEVIEVNGQRPREFTDLVMASAMSGRGETVSLLVKRPGVGAQLRFEVEPREGEMSRLLEMGLEPARSAKLLSARTEEDRARFAEGAAKVGLPGVEPGMTLVRIGEDREVLGAGELREAIDRSGGRPVEVEFADDSGKRVVGTLTPRPAMQHGWARMPSGSVMAVEHLLGLLPVMRVGESGEAGADRQGLRDNDLFARMGTVEYPSLARGIAEVHGHKGRQIDVTVLRRVDGTLRAVEVQPRPTVRNRGQGQIGFAAGTSADLDTLVAMPEPLSATPRDEAKALPAASIIARPGVRVAAVAGRPVGNFAELRAALREVTTGTTGPGAGPVTIPVQVQLPLAASGGTPPVETVQWTLAPADVRALHDLGWESPLDLGAFVPESYLLQASGPVDAMGMGIHKAHSVMMMTYLTFARLFEGTVKIEHLKGPIGIAHIGTRIADRGIVWLLFFMGLISINLAVINFLPLPIVDGGQFVFLLLEQVRGKPVSVEVQNVATVLGLVLIGAVFVVVTFHDIAGLFAG
ncbi:MAG: site-2 protease family protein [Phycisphaerales bacterium]